MHNLELAFPEKSEAERTKIARQFYRSLCDILVESIRLLSMSEQEILRRFKATNLEILQPYLDKKQSIVLVCGHTNNFELAARALGRLLLPYQVMAVYSPLKSEKLNRLILKDRTRLGIHLVSRRDVKAYYEELPFDLVAESFVADQSPSNAEPSKLHWTTFLTQTTSFVAGPERYAVRYDRPVLFLYLRRPKRGHYEMEIAPLVADGAASQPGEITEAYVRKLEDFLHQYPADWLWTHRRWKRGIPDSIQEQWPPEKGFIPPQYER